MKDSEPKISFQGFDMNFMSMMSLRAQVIKLIAAFFCLMTLVSCGGGGGWGGTPSGTPPALFTTAPSALTLVVGTAQTYTVSGGLAPYTVNSNNDAISVASIAVNKLSIAAVSVGAATIGILDASGKPIALSVTVISSATPLFTSAPASVTISNGGTRTYTIGGGLAPYTATSSDTIIAATSVIGSTLSIEGVAGGSTSVLVRDAANTIVTISVKVGFANTFFTTAPSALTILVGAAPIYTISGGSLNYAASSSNSNIVKVSVVGSSLTIAGVAAGTATVSVLDSTGATVIISVKVSTSATGVDTALYTTAAASITVAPGAAPTYGLGGGTTPYVATTSNAGVATASLSALGLTIVGVADGLAQIRVVDSTGAAVTIDVTVSAGAVTALYTTAPSTITLAKGDAAYYTIGGGRSPYTATTSNAGVATTSALETNLSIVGGSLDGLAQIKVVDAIGASVTISVTIGSGTSTALFTSAPSPVTISIAATSTYAIGGGTAPYTVNSGNASVATASGSGTSFTITGVAAGSTSVAIRDSVGGVVTVAVTVSPTASAPLTVLPGDQSGSVGDVLNFSISGGSPSYTVTVNNSSIASVTPTTVANSGGTFTATLRNVGSTFVTVADSQGQSTTITLTVAANVPTLRLSPSVVQVGENSVSPIVLNIYGGTAPYSAFTSDLVMSSVSITGTAAAPTLTVAVGSKGNRCITPASPFGTYDVILTVVDSLGASAISIMTIKDNGGAACP